jgi:arginine exporter protein ArgO
MVAIINGLSVILLAYCVWRMSFETLMGINTVGLIAMACCVFFAAYVSENTYIQKLVRFTGFIGLIVMAFVTYKIAPVQVMQ